MLLVFTGAVATLGSMLCTQGPEWLAEFVPRGIWQKSGTWLEKLTGSGSSKDRICTLWSCEDPLQVQPCWSWATPGPTQKDSVLTLLERHVPAIKRLLPKWAGVCTWALISYLGATLMGKTPTPRFILRLVTTEAISSSQL